MRPELAGLLAVLFGCAAAIQAAPLLPPCESPREVQDFLQAAANSADNANLPYAERRSASEKALAAMLEKYPRDLALHQHRRVLLIGPMFDNWKVAIKEYRRLYEAHPGDPLYRFLYARVLNGTQTTEAIRLLDGVLADYPGFAPAHLELARIHQWGVFKDTARAVSHLEAYRRACPDSTASFSTVLSLNDQAYFERSAQELRKLLEATPDSDAARLPAYGTLWTLEFRGRPASGHDALRKQVAADMKRLESLSPPEPQMKRWLRVLEQGYRLLNDKAAAERVEDRLTALKPLSRDAMGLEMERQYRKNEYPRTGVRKDEEAWARQQLEASRAWIERWPGAAGPFSRRLGGLVALEKIPVEDLHETADRLLENYARQPDEFRSFPPTAYRVAQAYLQAGTRLDRIPALIEAGTAELAIARERDQASDTEPPGKKHDGGYSLWFFEGMPIAIGASLGQGKPEEARKALREMEAYALANPGSKDEEDGKKAADQRNALLWEMRGRIAEAEIRPADAVVLYLRAEALQSMPPRPQQPHRVNAGSRARQLWKQLGGGTNEGLQALTEKGALLANPNAVSEGWSKATRVLPDFEITDTAGRVWRLADLKNKRTFINIWATWCGWCHPELPEVQKLHEEAAGRKDVAVITLNIDDNPGVIQPYLKEKGYTFPVLPALPLMEKMGVELSIPRNWIADAEGKIAWEQHGFQNDGPPSEWLRKRAAELLLLGTAAAK